MNHSQHSQINTNLITRTFTAAALTLLLASCGGGNGDVGTDPSSNAPTTSIKGKVTISSTVTVPTSKPTLMATVLSKTGLPQTGQNQRSTLFKSLAATTLAAPDNLNGATIELYNADKSEWLYPVASTTSDSDGNYLLNKLINDDKNRKEDGSAAYINGKPVPSGNYTVIAKKYDTASRTTLIAVQAIVKKFAGAILDNDLRAQDSDAIPTVVAMLGLAKNSDGTFGSTTTPVAVNANIQVFFSMAMGRQSVKNGISIAESGSTTPVAGKWKVSPDLTAATFYPDSDLNPNSIYSITVAGGGLSQAVKNIYDKPLVADVLGTFKTAPKDTTPPTAVRNSPGSFQKYNMSIMTPIRIGVDEELDITSIQVAARPTLGDKPAIKFVGKSAAASDAAYPYIYEVEPSTPLQLDTTYSLTVSGGLDMVGLSMDVLNFSFTTESTSAGIPAPTPTNAAEIEAKSAVKVVLGKWISALNARSTALLTSYMSGDFYWVNKTDRGFSRDDLNRDGRLSLNEFTGMLNTWFKDLDRCGSTVTGEVVTDDATVLNGITLSGATANIAFTITATPTNTSDATCDSGPDSTLYAVMENINQAWMMTSGSEYALPAALAPLTPIALLSPLDGIEFSDPTPPADPLTPEFQWKAVDGATTYMVVLIDGNSGQRTGWAALVDGSAATAGTPLSAKFIGKAGDYGNMIVLDTSASGASNPLGFDDMIFALQPGGEYYWAVIGFKEKTMAELKAFNVNLADYLIASSESSNFSVAGVLKALKIEVVSTAATSTVYPYSDTIGGYNVGSEASVTITVTSPNVLDTTKPGSVNVSGYVQKYYPLNFTIDATGLATASATISLSNVSNWVRVDDGTGVYDATTMKNSPGLTAEFSIYTKGGALPKIGITSVTGKKCLNGGSATLVGPNGWNNYSSTDACTVTVTGTIDAAFATGTTSLSINVHNNDGEGNYSTSISTAAGVISYTFPDIPVFKGQNWVSVSYVYYTTGALIEYHQNSFGIETDAGSTYTPPIAVTVTGASKTSSDIQRSTWDAGSANSVGVTVTMPKYSGMSTCSLSSDPNYSYRGSCSLTAIDSTFTVTLYQGWNYIYLFDGAGSYYAVDIYTTGGIVYVPPHAVTSITGGSSPMPITTPSYNYYQYDAGSACVVTINGTTTSVALPLTVNLSYYNSTTGVSIYETQSIPAVSSPYIFTQTVYGGGINYIGISDGSYNWQGVQVSTTCTNTPVVFGVSGVAAGGAALTPDLYGAYNTTLGTVTVSGTAKTDRIITAYVNGQYAYTSYTASATANAYTINLPLYTGYNDIYLDDGSNKFYLRVNTTAGGAVYKPPINAVDVSVARLVSGGGATDSKSSWDSSADTVTISGKALVDGAGYYYQLGKYYESKGGLTVTGGAFTLSNVQLGYGYNEFTLYDVKGNAYYLTIYTTGGIGAPAKIIQIKAPLDGATITVTGRIEVYGSIDASFVPVAVRAYTYDYVTAKIVYFSNQKADLLAGSSSLYYSSGTFSFTPTVEANNQTYIHIYADDAAGVRQEYGITVNYPPPR